MKLTIIKKWPVFALALLFLLIAGCAGFTSQGRLIMNNLVGNEYPTPEPVKLEPTDQSTASDLSRYNVNFSQAKNPGEQLNELMPELIKTAQVENGFLKVKGVPEKAGWYSDRSGPFYYQVVSGDFMVETTARAVKTADESSRPKGAFNSAGLLVRDASSAPSNMRWLMYNIGQQKGFYGTEAKSTVPKIDKWHMHRLAGFNSASTFWLTPAPEQVTEASLRICRVGDEFRFYKKFAGENQWQEETHQEGTTVLGNGAAKPTKGVKEDGSIRFVRDDLPATVQVGLIVNPGMPPNDGEGQFSGISFARLSDFHQCLL